MARYRLTAEARFDLREIARFGIERFGEQQAERYALALESLFARIAANPLAFQSVNDLRSGYRRAVYQSLSIYYRVEQDGVLIVRVLGQQQIDTALPK